MQHATTSLLAQARLLLDLIETGKHNPFERADAQVLQEANRMAIKDKRNQPADDNEDALL